MASKNFRLHDGENVIDWATVAPWGDTEIDIISDPSGASAKRQITSIPSPLARMDLFTTAFRHFKDDKNPIIGTKLYHKLVSDCFDLGQILFNYNTLNDKISIRVWNINSVNKELVSHESEKVRLYGKTIQLFLEQDSEAYNFNQLNNIYMVEYNNVIIGATSPKTLFFTTGNDLSEVNFKFGNDATFDTSYTPLHLRDEDYQLFIHHLFVANPSLVNMMSDFYEYLKRSKTELKNINPNLWAKINNLKAETFYSDYDTATILNTDDVNKKLGDIEILGLAFGFKKDETDKIAEKSDFTITNTHYKGELKPLVLQNGFNKNWNYISDKWDSNVNVPYFDEELNIDKRKLPGQEIKYPYLTISDFLESHLIQTPYPINKSKYFNGNLKIEVGNADTGYILPLKPKFFEYFTTEQLINERMPDGKPMFEMIQITNAVRVTLRIKVKKDRDYITFERLYFPTSEYELTIPDLNTNSGVIIENLFGINIFPFIKTNFPSNTKEEKFPSNYYSIQIIDADLGGFFGNNQYDIEFYKNGSLNPISKKRTEKAKKKINDTSQNTNIQYYILKNNFDFLQIKNSFANGVIIPIWMEIPVRNDVFSFSIDFGTTNSHIEYRIGERGKSQSFNYDETDSQIGTLNDPTYKLKKGYSIDNLIPHLFLPNIFGVKYKFPHRTVISESINFNHESLIPNALADGNIPFSFNQQIVRHGNSFSNLKWGQQGKANENRIKVFFEQILLMLRAKVLLNGGNLTETKLIWFYPSSMKKGRIDNLRDTIEKQFEDIFCSKQITVITESLAPFYYYSSVKDPKSGLNVSATELPVVSIDLGGGTTDIVIFKNEDVESNGRIEKIPVPITTTSFKFAGNALFGEAFNKGGDAKSNGFVAKYSEIFSALLETHSKTNSSADGLQAVFLDKLSKDSPEEVNNLFFDLEKHIDDDISENFSYNLLLSKDENLKLLIVYFYCSVIYHLARMMKYLGIERPSFVLFSGTASKLLGIISGNIETISELTEEIYKQIYGKENYDPGDDLTVIREEKTPKEVTCKGGIMVDLNDLRKFANSNDNRLLKLQKRLESANFVYSGIGNGEEGETNFESLKYDDLNDTIYDKVVDEVKIFNKFFIELSQTFEFANNLNINPNAIDIFSKNMNTQLKVNLTKGLNFNRQLDVSSSSGGSDLEETMFFYPIIGSINFLGSLLSKI